MTGAPRIAALDGLRGLAVVAVVIYHAWPTLLPGGWIGVSVFFVVSGYLITGILVRSDGQSLAQFWSRRARRLLPAAVATVAGTVLVVAISDAASLASTAREGLAATAYVHNWWSAANTGGYWEIFDSTPRPLAHMWSLSIEEQVYVIWPLLIVVLGARRALTVGLLIVVAGSVAWWGRADGYFATPVRFAEVLAGAALAVAVARKPSLSVPPAAVAVGGAVLVWWTLVLEESDPWVSTGALLVIALASTVVIAGVLRPSLLATILSTSPLVWLGKSSYAIYLFHWPLLVLLGAPPWVAVLATLGLAELSHHVLEWPIRSGQRLKRPLPVLGALSAVLAIALIATAAAAPAPASDAEVAAATVAALKASSTTMPTSTTAPDRPAEETTTTTAAPLVHVAAEPTTIIVGDSTGYTVQPAVEGWIESVGGTVLPGAFVSCGPLFNEVVGANWAGIAWTGEVFGPFDGGCRPAIDQSVDLVLVIDHGVVLMDHLEVATDRVTSIEDPVVLDLVRDEYQRMISAATAADATVLIFTPPKTAYPRGDNADTQPADIRLALYRSMIDELAAINDHVVVIDTAAAVESNPERYVRTDGLHLDSDTGAVNFVVDLVAPEILFDNG